MQIKTALLTAAAALSTQVAAEFIVITDYPQALQTLSPQQAQSYLSSILPAIRSDLLALATDTSYIARATSVLPQLQNFAATATISLPPAVTAIDQLEIYTTVPDWYSQLPSPVRSLYDDVADVIQSQLSRATPVPAGNASASAGTTPSMTRNTTAPASSTSNFVEATPFEGGVGRREVALGGGVLAGLVGLLAL